MTDNKPMDDKLVLRELIVSTLWGKNYNDLTKFEKPVVNTLVISLAALLDSRIQEARYNERKTMIAEYDELLTNPENNSNGHTDAVIIIIEGQKVRDFNNKRKGWLATLTPPEREDR